MRKPHQLVHALALAAALTTTAHAAAPVPVQWVDPNGVPITVRQGPNGLPIIEQSPAARAYDFRPMVISAIFHNAFDTQNGANMTNRDSTIVFDTRGYNRAALYLWATPTALSDIDGGSGDSLGAAIVALQVRHHEQALSDTNNTLLALRHMPLPYNSTTGIPTGARDSIGSLTDVGFYGEAQTYNIRQVCLPDERPINITNLGAKANRGMVIWSDRVGAGEIEKGSSPLISFRLRLIQTFRFSTMATYTGLVDSTAVGTPRPMRMRIRCDLVLWNE